MSLLDPKDTDTSIDPNKDYLAELTGPGGKFDRTKYESDEDMYKAMARGKWEADKTIAFKMNEFDRLKEDYLKLHEDYKASASLSELIDKLSKTQTESNESTQNVNTGDTKPALTQEDLEGFLEQKMTQREIRQKEEANYKLVENKLKEQLGDNYASTLRRQAEQLGLSTEDVEHMAKRSPEAFFKAFGLDAPKQGDNYSAPPRSSVRSDSFTPTGGNKRTWSYYEKLRKESPSEYLSGKTQTQMMKDMAELGEAFEDGNYKNLSRL